MCTVRFHSLSSGIVLCRARESFRVVIATIVVDEDDGLRERLLEAGAGVAHLHLAEVCETVTGKDLLAIALQENDC